MSSTAPFDFDTQRQFEIDTGELQHIFQTEKNTLLAGGRWQAGEFETDGRLSLIRPNFSGGFASARLRPHSVSISSARASTCMTTGAARWLTLIGGVSWDHIEHPDNFRNPPVNDRQREDERVSGKVGFTLRPSILGSRLRGAYTEALGGVTFDESVRLEPVQVAGFNQAYRTVISESLAGSVETPVSKRGPQPRRQLPSRTWWACR